MKIIKFTTGHTTVEAPDFTPVNKTDFMAAVLDEGELVLAYTEPAALGANKVLVLTFNRYETGKIRSALNKGG